MARARRGAGADGDTGVTPLGVVEIGRGQIAYAPAVRAGRWVFATGLLATDYVNGLAPEVLQVGLPRNGPPQAAREAAHIYARLAALLEEAGTDLSEVVRVDQYYRGAGSVDPYHVVRTEAFAGHVPASTSILMPGLLLPGAEVELQALAAIPSPGFRSERIRPEGIYVPKESGHSPAVRLGDFVFLSGQIARGPDGNVPPEARVPSNHLWKGTQIKREAEYLITEKLAPALAAAGAGLDGLLKAQVYLSDVNDLPAFREVWNAHLPEGTRPAVTYVPTSVPGFGTVGVHAEVNVIALRDEARGRRSTVDAGVFTGFDGDPQAVAVDDLLLLSGLMAVDRDGAIPEARSDPRQPHFGSPAAAQMRCILERADALCHAAGTSLDNVVRAQHFYTNIGEFQAVHDIWRERLGGRPVPFSAVQVPAPLPVPGCSLLVDLWVYRPPGAAGRPATE